MARFLASSPSRFLTISPRWDLTKITNPLATGAGTVHWERGDTDLGTRFRPHHGLSRQRSQPDARDIYVTDPGSDDVSVIDPTTNTVIDTITVGDDPSAVAVEPIGPDAGDICVINLESDDVSVIDPTTNTVVSTVGVGTDPIGVTVETTGPDAGDIFVTNGVSNTVSILAPWHA
jgi:YVTN family beta-propeller protein